MVRFKEFENSAIRIAEQNRLSEQMEAYREELEQQHQEKLEKLRRREREVMEKCGDRVKMVEGVLAEHRAKMMRDLEEMREREERVGKERMLNEEVWDFLIFSNKMEV